VVRPLPSVEGGKNCPKLLFLISDFYQDLGHVGHTGCILTRKLSGQSIEYSGAGMSQRLILNSVMRRLLEKGNGRIPERTGAHS
jgi:hypothetical protein